MLFTLRPYRRFPMRYVVMAMLIILTCLGLSMAKAATLAERESMRGLRGVEVVVEDITLSAQADGLSQEAIRTAVELILRSSGIQSLTSSENDRTPSAPILYVRISTSKSPLGLYTFFITIDLDQRVSLVQMPQLPQLTMRATTWRTNGTVGSIDQYKLSEIIKYVEGQVKAFANDFLAVNPR